MKPKPTPEVCEAEIRREGAKLEHKRKEEALRRAHYASYQDPHDHTSNPYLFHLAYENSTDHVKDSILSLILSIQQRQKGGMKPHSLIN